MAHVHIVEQGECLNEIAARYGFPDGKTLYHHPENSDLRSRRDDANTLLPGDQVVIPAPGQKTQTAAPEKKHRFRLRTPTKPLRLELRDERADRFANRDYELKICKPDAHEDDCLTYTGKLDADGCLEEDIPAVSRKGTLIVATQDNPYELKLLIDHLDPADEMSGIQGRLKNLGFDPGPIDGIAGPRTRQALSDYQQAKGFTASGEADRRTLDALKADHKS